MTSRCSKPPVALSSSAPSSSSPAAKECRGRQLTAIACDDGAGAPKERSHSILRQDLARFVEDHHVEVSLVARDELTNGQGLAIQQGRRAKRTSGARAASCRSGMCRLSF